MILRKNKETNAKDKRIIMLNHEKYGFRTTLIDGYLKSLELNLMSQLLWLVMLKWIR